MALLGIFSLLLTPLADGQDEPDYLNARVHMKIGYNKPHYVLPFDHSSSFEKGLFGWTGALSNEQNEKKAQSKAVIYDGFQLAVSKGVPRDSVEIASASWWICSSAPLFCAMQTGTAIIDICPPRKADG